MQVRCASTSTIWPRTCSWNSEPSYPVDWRVTAATVRHVMPRASTVESGFPGAAVELRDARGMSSGSSRHGR